MRIEYESTIHRLRCLRCGQIFFAEVGNIYEDKTPPPQPHRMMAQCPNCVLRDRISHPYFKKLCIANATARRYKNVRFFVEHDCVCGQVAAGELVKENNDLRKQLLSMRLTCEKVIESWENDWQRTVMHTQMSNLARILKQLEADTFFEKR